MPELAEVARVVYYLGEYLVGKQIKSFTALEDTIVFKNGDVTSTFTDRKVTGVDRRGKYFWLTFDSPKCAVMHLGMTGWVQIQNHTTAPQTWYAKKLMQDPDIWPPRFWKFHLETTDDPPIRVAFTDARRLARVIVVDIKNGDPLLQKPLGELGLDPISDTDKITIEFLTRWLSKKSGSIKGRLLDQTGICGIGNWMADEILYHAEIHPEEICKNIVRSNDTSGPRNLKPLQKLYDAILYVSKVAFDNLADDDKFPDNWLFKHRWSRGKGGPGTLPSGEKLSLVTVAGRTSCIVPTRQRLLNNTALADGSVKSELPETTPVKKISRKRTKKVVLVMAEEDQERVNNQLLQKQSSHLVDSSGDDRREKRSRVTRSQMRKIIKTETQSKYFE